MLESKLASWLIEECNHRDLSWSEASRRAGLAPNSISEVINGSSVGLKRLLALAEFFGTSPEYVLRLAGHLPPAPNAVDVPRLQEFSERVARLPAERVTARELTRALESVPDQEQRRVTLEELSQNFAMLLEAGEPAEIAAMLQAAGVRVYVEEKTVRRVCIE